MKYIFHGIVLLLITASCQKREWQNPYDPDTPKVTWSPSGLEATQDGNSVKLTWQQANTNISGFVIMRNEKDGSYNEVARVSKDVLFWNDNEISGGIKYGYQVFAYAGSNQSNPAITYFTPVLMAQVSTSESVPNSCSSATSGGNVTSDGGATVTARGVCWSTLQNPTTTDNNTSDGTGTGVFSSSINGLAANTTYYVRAYATNSAGTGYGTQVSFTSLTCLPTVITSAPSDNTSNSAFLGGNVTNDGGASVTTRGIIYSTSTSPCEDSTIVVIGSGTGLFGVIINGLIPGLTYYVRAFAYNNNGIVFGDEISFIAKNPTVTVTDVEGNIYKTVQIGTQEWMAENLKTTKYSDGSSIPNIRDNSAWAALTTDAYCYYDNDSNNKTIFGTLYNWYSVNIARLCPTGWHVPTDGEWTELEHYLIDNGYNYDGTISDNKIAKSLAATTLWTSSDIIGAIGNYSAANNKSGFSGFPGGFHKYDGTFNIIGRSGYWWSSTETSTTTAMGRELFYNFPNLILTNFHKGCGFSVRCIRDN